LCFADYAAREGGPAVATQQELMKHDMSAAMQFYMANRAKILMWSHAGTLRLDACWAMVDEAPTEAEKSSQRQVCIDVVEEMQERVRDSMEVLKRSIPE
jgi:hypothetical protein